MFILRLWRLDNLNCVLFLTVFIKVLGTCLVLNYAVSFVKQCSSVCTWLTKQHSKIAWENVEKCLISCWYYVPCVGTILNFQDCFVMVRSLISYFTVLIQHVLYAWSSIRMCSFFICFAEQRHREDLSPTKIYGRYQSLFASECSMVGSEAAVT